MPSSIVALAPRTGAYGPGLAAYRAARLRDCLTQLHALPGHDARALRARAFLRLGNSERALSELEQGTENTWCERSESSLLRAVACGRLGGNDDRADAQLLEARVFAISAGDATREAEAEFYSALAAFGTGDIDVARAAAVRGLECANLSPLGTSSQAIPFAHVVARLQELLGLIEAAGGAYRKQLVHARETLATLDACAVKDVWQEGFAIRNLAVLVRDFDLASDASELRARIATLPWTDELSPMRFRSLSALSWCAMLRGEHLDALRSFREAASAATTIPERVEVAVDRALHARSVGHGPMATEELEHALDLAEAFDWNAADGDIREVLLVLAQAAVTISPERARAALGRYTANRSTLPSVYVARLEARVRAEESYTHGVLLRAEGQAHASTDRLKNAFATWAEIGFDWRAARAAVELAELGAGDAFRFAVRRELHARPNSVFAERARLAA